MIDGVAGADNEQATSASSLGASAVIPRNQDPFRATRAITEFLRHARLRDLPDSELFELKAHAFEVMAEQYDADGPSAASMAAECRQIAAESREVAQSSKTVGA